MPDLEPPAAAETPGDAGRAPDRAAGRAYVLVPLWLIAAAAVVLVVREAKPFLAPVIASAVLAIALSPLSRVFERRLRFGKSLSALISLAIATSVVAGALWLLIPAADDWQARLSELAEEAERKLWPISATIDEVKKATEKVGEAANLSGTDDRTTITVQQEPGYFSTVLTNAPFVIIQVLTTLVVCFFFLRERRWLMRSGIGLVRDYRVRYRLAHIAHEIRRNVGTYFLITISISAGVGVVTALGFFAIGMPAPATWGGAIAVANFVPFIGPFLVAVASFIAGLAVYDSLEWCLLPPAIIFAVNVVEENAVIPMVIGRHFYTSPVVIILSVLFGAWLWGAIGGVLAVPTAIIVLSTLRRWRELSSHDSAPVQVTSRAPAAADHTQ